MNLKNMILASLLCCGVASHAQQQVSIYDIQYVDPQGSSDVSPYNSQLVITSGVVTASGEFNNLGAVFIQQEGLNAWAGIQLASGSGLGALLVGDSISVTGTVSENFGMTVLNFVTNIDVHGSSNIDPIQVDPNIFTSPDISQNEQYEGMLIELRKTGGPISVVNANADGPGNNFGEWRVGSDAMNSNEGCRILTGRQTSSVTSSLNVSWVNSDQWATNSGTMNVDPIVVNEGDDFEAIRGLMSYGFSNFKLLPRNNDDVITTSGVHHVVGLVSGLSVEPNPTQGDATVSFELIKSSEISVRIRALSGQTIATPISAQLFPAGKHDLRLRLPEIRGSYLISVEGDHGILTTQLIRG